MRNLSKAFRDKLAENRAYLIGYADITLSSGTVLSLSNSEIWTNGIGTEDAVSDDNEFSALGSAIIGSATLIINNIDETYSEYDFTNAKVVLYLGMELDDTNPPRLEKPKLGTYTVDEALYNGATITLNMLDNMEQFDRPYNTNLVYPATLDQIVRDACLKCGVTLNTYTFPHRDYTVQTKPTSESTTFRDVIGWAAAIAGCFARCNVDGELEFKWFDQQTFEHLWEDNLDGGYFDNTDINISWLQPYMNTTDGMTTIRDTMIDDGWDIVPNSIGFEFNGVVSDNIYIDSDSAYAFGNSTPSSHAHSSLKDINIMARDGQVVDVKYQEISTANGSAIKIRYKGYTRYGASYQTEDYQNEHEIFFTSNGFIVVNFILIPTDTSYRGTTNIRENNITTSFTPETNSTITLIKVGNSWVIDDDTSVVPYPSGDTADGGSFNPWNTGYVYDGGDFLELTYIHYLTSLYSQDISIDDVVITGVKLLVKDEEDDDNKIKEYLSGTAGYVIEVSNNEFITTSTAQTIVTWLGNQLNGLRFRKVTVQHTMNPAIEAGDIGLVIDHKERRYPILITRTNFAIAGTQTTVCSASTPSRNSATRYSSQTKSYVESRKLLNKETTIREQQIEALQESLAEASGLYSTIQTTASGNIYYLHDKPTLVESKIVWKMTTDAWGVTTNYNGEHPEQTVWNAGMTVDGNTIVRILSATGINADWINTGSLNASLITTGTLNANRIRTGTISDYQNKNSWNLTTGEFNTKSGTIGPWSLSSDGLSASIVTYPATNEKHTLETHFTANNLYVHSWSENIDDPIIIMYDECAVDIRYDRVRLVTNGPVNFGLFVLFQNRVNPTYGIRDFEHSDWILRTGEDFDTFPESQTVQTTIIPRRFYCRTFDNTNRPPILATNNTGYRILRLYTSASAFGIYGEWGEIDYVFSSRTISVPSSDIRLKENIHNSTVNALPIINAIKIREFDWTDNREDKHQKIGFVADELEELDERFAIGGGYDEDGLMKVKSVDTFYMQGYEVKAIQELSAKVEELTETINKLTARIAELEANN